MLLEVCGLLPNAGTEVSVCCKLLLECGNIGPVPLRQSMICLCARVVVVEMKA